MKTDEEVIAEAKEAKECTENYRIGTIGWSDARQNLVFLAPDLAARLAASNAEVERLRKENEWRPIAEAPKDGTSILTFPHYHITHWDMEIESFTHGWDEDAERFKPMRWAPTHWMPLPTPPKDV